MSTHQKLRQLLRFNQCEAKERELRNSTISEQLLNTSTVLDGPLFTQIANTDLQVLFELYDEQYFGGLLQKQLGPSPISFRLSKRMTRAGGKTTRWKRRNLDDPARYEIAISTTLLFESFQDPERPITVTGLSCDTRLAALMRIMEHEIVHLSEMLVWTDSSCAQYRFQSIASKFFGHTDHRHDLPTPGEIAANQGIGPGRRVQFLFEGELLEGLVSRITRRATVLVPDSSGQKYSDGHRYVKYYIPLQHLQVAE